MWMGVVNGNSCPTSFFKINNPTSSSVYDVMTFDFPEPTPLDSYCSRIWPNEVPEISMFPVPPGCLFFGIPGPVGSDNQLPMKVENEGEKFVHWIPESELASSLDFDPFNIEPLKCDTVISKTTTESRLIVVGENCIVGPSCRPTTSFNATATCEIEEESTEFLETSGWHRNLGALLHAGFENFALQWLPRHFFAEIDELERKTGTRSRSLAVDVNIENPSMISPPQLVRVDAFPIPVHARVNPPKKGETHFTVNIPKAIWLVPGGVSDCSVEKLKLVDLVKIPDIMKIPESDYAFLVKTKTVRGTGSYTTTEIPSGNPDDLLEAVAVTAVTATAGAIAIVVASLRK